jgi:hypothetical protein
MTRREWLPCDAGSAKVFGASGDAGRRDVENGEAAVDPVSGLPRIQRVNEKIGSLERRLTHLEQRIRDTPQGERRRAFDVKEREAVEAAIVALRTHRSMVDPETSPVLALEELVMAIVEAGLHKTSAEPRVEDAIRRAQRVLRDARE